jgi:hypothetical protein
MYSRATDRSVLFTEVSDVDAIEPVLDVVFLDPDVLAAEEPQ